MLRDDTLDRLFAADEAGLEAWRHDPPTGRVTVVETSSGPVVTWDGRALHSRRDPVREAERTVHAHIKPGATFVLVLGLGNGHVVASARQRVGPAVTIVVFEPNIDVLRASLGLVGDDPRTVVVTSLERLDVVLRSSLRNRDVGAIVPWVPSLRTHPQLFAEAMACIKYAVTRANVAQNTLGARTRSWFDHYLQHVGTLATTPGLPALANALRDLPLVVVAAGPSLDRNISVLKRIRDRVVIFCVNTAALALDRAGIVPDALVALESLDVSLQLQGVSFLSEVVAFVDLTSHPNVWALPFAAKIPYSGGGQGTALFSRQVHKDHHVFGGYCVANTAVAVGARLGCNPIILVGSDLAYTEGRVYAQGTLFQDMALHTEEDGRTRFVGNAAKHEIEARSGGSERRSTVPTWVTPEQVPAWGGTGMVHSSHDFSMYREWYTRFGKTVAANGVALFNATEGGSHIEHWQDVPLAEVAASLRAQSEVSGALRRALARCQPTPIADLEACLARERQQIASLLAVCEEGQRLESVVPSERTETQTQRFMQLAARARSHLVVAHLISEAALIHFEYAGTQPDESTAYYAELHACMVALDSSLQQLLAQLHARAA